jgi:hypothetical protein
MQVDTPVSDNSLSLAEHLKALAQNAWFAYSTIILLQIKVMWGLWQYRDLTLGDTSSYYGQSLRWAESFQVDPVWSPLYTSLLGTFHRIIGDAFWTTTLVHFLIAILATVLVLTILRQILPKPLAWFITAWWAVLPITFDTVYSAHSFALLFPLLIFLVLAYLKGIYGRGIALSIFIVITVLIRNEYIIAVFLWLLFCLVYELLRQRQGNGELPARLLIAYGVPIFAACGLILFVGIRSYIPIPEIMPHLKPKHTDNVCQTYAYNRVQQGDVWTGHPWLQCRELMIRDFGVAAPTLTEAFLLNPGAMAGHFWWDITLIPSGMQLALFNAYAGNINPDFLPAQESEIVWLPFLLVLQGVVFGLYSAWQKRAQWSKTLEQSNLALWIAMLCIVAVTIFVMAMQRPRPSYMFAFTFVTMALFGFGLSVLLQKTVLARIGEILTPIIMITLLLLIPPYYSPAYLSRGIISGQPVRYTYQRLLPFVEDIPVSQRITIMTPQWAGDICLYLHGNTCTPLSYGEVVNNKPAVTAFAPYFEGLNVDWIYFNAATFNQPATQLIRDELLAAEWDVAASGTDVEGTWMILESPNAPS